MASTDSPSKTTEDYLMLETYGDEMSTVLMALLDTVVETVDKSNDVDYKSGVLGESIDKIEYNITSVKGAYTLHVEVSIKGSKSTVVKTGSIALK